MATATKSKPKASVYQPRLKKLYREKIRVELKNELKLKNIYEAPEIIKVIVSCGLGKAKDDKRLMETATNTLAKVTGQKSIQTSAKKSVAAFKLREGNKIGLKVTLRNDRMYEFIDRLINIVMPRLRDFHGVSSRSFDKQGNYNIGLVDQSVFPELSYEETNPVHGMQVTLVINSSDIEHSKLLLTKLGLPFEKEAK